MKLFPFLTRFGNESTITQELRNERLLACTVQCDICHENMTEKHADNGDGLMFYCWRRTCRRKKSIRIGSFFENSKLTLRQSMLFLHLWGKGYSEKLIVDDFDFSQKTVIDWSRFCRELCVYEIENDNSMIGGTGTTVEIDETLAVRRKYNRGRILSDGWIFGGIERRVDDEFKCFFVMVYNRSEDHLVHLIRERVLPGTHIITDGWPAYRNLSSFGYSHSVVIHEDNFVDPADENIHTQRIESTWCSLKRFIRSRGTFKSIHYLEYICEYLFRRRHSDTFHSILNVIRNKYPF
jgi:hypothetical protein